MPPEFWTIVANWGFPALLIAYVVWRFDQSILPVMLDHFKKLGEGFDTLKQAVENQTKQTNLMTSIASRIEEVGDGLSRDHESIADDAKNAHHHARRAADGVDEILRIIPQRINHEKEVG